MKYRLPLALCLGAAILWLVQSLLVPKYTMTSPEGSLTGEYYANTGGNDVIFIGDCEVYENFSPVTLWTEYGIPSYIRGSAQQTIWQSFYLLEETLRHETPRVVVFNVLSMKYDTPQSTGSPKKREAYNRMTLDTMAWSSAKWKAVQASMTEEESLLTYLFPLLRYHDRWSSLTREDFAYCFSRQPVAHNGYLMQTGVRPVTDEYVQPPLADYRFGQASWDYLDKIADLCEANGVELILIKAPSLYPVWWDAWDRQISAYAAERGLLYINMLRCQEEIGIDWSADTYDAGLHLNVFGAEKLTHWFGQILSGECGLPDRRGDEALNKIWAEKAAWYASEKESRLLEVIS